MPLQTNGEMHPRFFGNTPHEQLIDKIAQMRTDLRHIHNALERIDRKARANAPAAALKPEFSILHDWYLSALESFFAMTWAAFDHQIVKLAVRDFENKFKHFTSERTIVAAGRQRP